MILQTADIQQILRNLLKSDDFEIITSTGVGLDDVSIGFLSAQDKECIRYRTRGKEEELRVFIKGLPESTYHRDNVISTGVFHKEVVLFNGILKSYHEEMGDHSIPRCYLARSDDILVLEDMSSKGFKNTNHYETFDLQHCEKTLETLAKFHSFSFVTEKKEGRTMSELFPLLTKDGFLSADENNVGRKGFLESIRVMKILIKENLSYYSPEVIRKASDYFDNMSEMMKSSKLYPNVLSHSDLWANNIMFKYDESGSVEEACILDFQLASYTSPAYDVLLFLHTCTDVRLRDRHYGRLMKHYYRSLSKRLSSSGMDIEDIMTWSDFENMLEESLPLALAQACRFLHLVLIPSDKIKDILASPSKYKMFYEQDRSKVILDAMESPVYSVRVVQALIDLLNYFVCN